MPAGMPLGLTEFVNGLGNGGLLLLSLLNRILCGSIPPIKTLLLMLPNLMISSGRPSECDAIPRALIPIAMSVRET